MNIVMITNTYLPHVGGVARSVAAFTAAYRSAGHRVLVVAPIFENMPEDEEDVVRVPALQNFNGSDFSMVLPIPGFLNATVREFAPDVIHSHHPYLLGATAMRLARAFKLPLVFTYHTMYEQYTHYVPGESEALKRFVVRLGTSYANLCQTVFAPSESMERILRERGVTAPIRVVPTGVDAARFASGDGAGFRKRLGIPPGAFVAGHLGRLAPEKNLPYLARALSEFLNARKRARVVMAGEGPSKDEVRRIFRDAGVGDRLHLVGVLTGRELADCYHAMDLFAFSSHSETQGMVLTEAMAAGVPVVALDANGAREVVINDRNGRLLASHTPERDFAAAMVDLAGLSAGRRSRLREAALATAERFSMKRTARTALAAYGQVQANPFTEEAGHDDTWKSAVRLIRGEWDMLRALAGKPAARRDGSATRKGPSGKWDAA